MCMQAIDMNGHGQQKIRKLIMRYHRHGRTWTMKKKTIHARRYCLNLVCTLVTGGYY